jgi:hypothetical protein
MVLEAEDEGKTGAEEMEEETEAALEEEAEAGEEGEDEDEGNTGAEEREEEEEGTNPEGDGEGT